MGVQVQGKAAAGPAASPGSRPTLVTQGSVRTPNGAHDRVTRSL